MAPAFDDVSDLGARLKAHRKDEDRALQATQPASGPIQRVALRGGGDDARLRGRGSDVAGAPLLFKRNNHTGRDGISKVQIRDEPLTSSSRLTFNLGRHTLWGVTLTSTLLECF